jgi:hypothetical protein
MPKGAKCRKARNPDEREIAKGADRCSRRLEFGALWNSAPFGIQRRSEFSAVS